MQNWADMEKCFHDRFYWPQPEVSAADLMNLRQKVDESPADFVERFRRLARKCSVQFPEAEYASMAISGMHPQLKEKLVGQACTDLNSLATRAVRIEQFIQEKEKKRAARHRGPSLVSIIEAEESDDESADSTVDIMAAEIVKESLFMPCPESSKGQRSKDSRRKNRIFL